MLFRQFHKIVFGMVFATCASFTSSAQVALTSHIPYGSTSGPNGQRVWVSLGWKVRLAQGSEGWSCTLSSGPMVGLVQNRDLVPGIPWQDQSYTYGALFRVGLDGTQLYAWHKGPAQPKSPSNLNVFVSVKQSGQLHFPIVERYTDNGNFIMKSNVPRDVLLNVILPDIANNEVFHLSVDQTSYGLGSGVFRYTFGQFQECLEWMEKYNAESPQK